MTSTTLSQTTPQPPLPHVQGDLAQQPARPFQVLYVEDDPASQRLLVELFKTLPGFRLECADSAEDGIELAHVRRPDLILMDLNLPSLDGFQAQGILAREYATRHIPVVALSARSLDDELQRAESSGFLAYLTKPLDLGRLTALLHERAALRD